MMVIPLGDPPPIPPEGSKLPPMRSRDIQLMPTAIVRRFFCILFVAMLIAWAIIVAWRIEL